MLFKNLKSLIAYAALIFVLLSSMSMSTISANAEAVSSLLPAKGLSKLGGTIKLDGGYSGAINLEGRDSVHSSVFLSETIKPFSSLLTANSSPTSPEYLITGIDNPRAMFGFSVNSAGDVNGDGFDDVIIGAREYWEGESAEGAAFLYLGSSSGEFSTPAWSVQANQPYAAMGGSVDTAGDVNGDGYDDILVGVFQYTLGEVGEGAVFAYYGSPNGPSTTPDWIGQINQANAKFGWSVSNAGDVNNDGYDDVIIGSRYYSNGQADEGKAFLYLGSAMGLASVPAWSKEIDVQNAGFGYSVSDAGDVNGDGYDDVLVTSYNYIYAKLNGGKAYLFLGEPDGLSATASWIGESNIPMDGYGYIGANAGDVNGDGYSDILVGAPAGDNNAVNGKAYLYYGSASGPSLQPDWFAQGTTTGLFGSSLSSAGDYNHDGYDDILVGDQIYYIYPSIGGAVFLYLGGSSVPSTQPYLSYTSGVNNSAFASAVGSAGQFNGDAYDDFLVGAPMWTSAPYGGGHAVMFFGRAICTSSSITITNINDSGAGSLRQALADICSGGTITFNSSLAGQTIVLASALVVDKDLTIDGSSLASKLNISGNNSIRVISVNSGATLTIKSLIIKNGKSTENGGGIYNSGGTLIVTDSIFSANSAVIDPYVVGSGEGGAIYSQGVLTIINSTFNGNDASRGGAISCNGGTITVKNSTYFSNSALSDSGGDGGAIYENCNLTIANSTFSANAAAHYGGAILSDNDINPIKVTNSTFSGNTALDGGGIANYGGLIVTNDTFSNNSASNGGAIYNGIGGVLSLRNSILANSVEGVDCIKSDVVPAIENINNLIETTGTGFESCGTSILISDPLLGPLQDNGGSTKTMALLPSSPAIDAGDDTKCPTNDQRGVPRPQGNHCDIGAYEAEQSIVNVTIGISDEGSYPLSPHESQRKSYPGVNNGPVKITKVDKFPIMASERVIYKVNGINTSFSEMMALPDSRLTTVYWLPWYNNVDLDTQLRLGNVSGSMAHVHISIGGVEMADSPFTLTPGESRRVSFAGVNKGPVKIESDQYIVAAERVIYKVNGVNTSFSEMMAAPNNQLYSNSWFPWYNNVDLDTQLRFANVMTNQTATVRVYIHGQEMKNGCTPVNSPYTLKPGESLRVSCAGVNNGPVMIESDGLIVASERVIYKVSGVNISFTEMMGSSYFQLDNTYWLPWYNNVDLDTQLRFANVGDGQATVHVFIGGVEVPNSPFILEVGQSTRQRFTGMNNGPVKIESDHGMPIVASERVIYKVNGINTSFSELMALPNNQLSATYWLPWYNNVDLDTQLRFGVP